MDPISLIDRIIGAHWLVAAIVLLTGIFLLWFCSEVVVRKINPVAGYFRVNELVITILGVSILSSLPELAVSSAAAFQGKPDISIGNIVGSNFVTLTFVTAVAALISPLSICTEIKERESSWMVLSSAIILVLAADGTLSRIDGVLLMVLYIPYIYTVIREAARSARENGKEAPSVKEARRKTREVLPHILLGILAIFGIIIGAELALRAGESIGTRLGITPLVLGVLILAVGTSLPELAVAVAAISRRKADVTIGEIYASNIFTALFILGICCLIAPMSVADNILRFDIPLLILSGVVVQIFVTTGSRLVRLEALIILLLYIYFVLGHFIKMPSF